MEKCAFLTQSLDLKTNEGVEVQCHVCKSKRKGGLTLFKFYSKQGKVYWKNQVVSCQHIEYDGEPGCSCCHTIRDGKPVCGECAGWDIMSGGITKQMKYHNFTWHDNTVSAWKPRPHIPYKQYECECGHIRCFKYQKTVEEYECPKCKPKRSLEDLERENKQLRAKLAKIEHLLK